MTLSFWRYAHLVLAIFSSLFLVLAAVTGTILAVDAIQEKMFVFEDFLELEDRSLQTLLTEVPQETLIIALKGASPKLREKIFKNMAKRSADTVREDLETRPPVKVIEVELSQKDVIAIARALSEEGRVNMERGKSADAFL